MKKLFATVCALACLGLHGAPAPHLLCVGALHAQGGGFSPEPGNPGHVEPPPGWTCATDGQGEHACDCHKECQTTEDGKVYVQEDYARCKVSCFKDACRCEVHKCE